MFRRRRKKQEWLPWYRRKDYKSDLTEGEKKELDAFRLQDKHPAALYEDLPEEVQSYISNLDLQVYDLKQDEAVTKSFFASAVGAIIIFLTYKGLTYGAEIFGYVFGVLLLTVPWFIYRRRFKKNADEHFPDYEVAPSPIDEGIRQEWELNYITGRRRESSD